MLCKKSLFLLLFSLVYFCVLGQGWDGNTTERFLNFHVDIEVDTTGRMEIKEYISVYANGRNIRRGIFRQIPIYRTDVYGKKHKLDIKVLSVSRDGNPEEYSTSTEGDYREIRIGSPDVLLSPGKYDYLIVYETYGHVGFFDDYDEIYWNVTGNESDFDIESASARVILPSGVEPLTTDCYTGVYGSTDKDCRIEVDSGQGISFFANGALESGEGLSVAVSFPRDVIKRPPPPTEAELFWMLYKKYIIIGLTLLILGCYYFFTWRKVGVDPRKPVVIPTFKSPNDWSPAVLRYLYKLKYDNKAFSVAIINLAVKGYLQIEKTSSKYKLIKKESTQPLSQEEKSLYNTLFKGRTELTVSNSLHTVFANAEGKVKGSLLGQFNIEDYFKKNTKYVVMATLLNILAMILYSVAVTEVLLAQILLAVFVVLLLVIRAAWKSGSGCAIVFLIYIGANFLFAGISSMFQLADINTLIYLGMLAVGYLLYIYLIKAPTKLGAQTEAELNGFKMYLKTAEEDRLNILTPPDHTPELYEKMLPYAIALDVENQWGKKFNSVLEKANYNPEWYTGTSTFRPATFASSLSRGLTSSVGTAKHMPSSSGGGRSSGGSWSSGSGGGGFSGGGGGGGRSGGW